MSDRQNPKTSTTEPIRLTRKQHDTLQATAEGLTDRQIAEKLGVPWSTINSRQRVIRELLGTTTRGGTIAYALRHGLLHTTTHTPPAGCPTCRQPGHGVHTITRNADLTDRLRDVRRHRDQGQNTFAAQHGFTRNQMSNWERDLTELSLTQAIDVANACGYDLALIPRYHQPGGPCQPLGPSCTTHQRRLTHCPGHSR